MQLAAQAEALQQAPAGFVLEEARRGDPANTEVGEAEAEELPQALGGVAGVSGIVDPAELHPEVPGPPVAVEMMSFASKHDVTDDLGPTVVAEGDQKGGGRPRGLGQVVPVAVEVGRAAGEPLADRLEPADLPGRVGVTSGGGTDGEALGLQRTLENRPADRGRRTAVADLDEDGTDVAQ